MYIYICIHVYIYIHIYIDTVYMYSTSNKGCKVPDSPWAGPVVIHWTLVASLLCGDSGLRRLGWLKHQRLGETN